MSFDISLIDNKCDACGRGDEVYSFNYTHNTNEIIERALTYAGGANIKGTDEKRGYQDRTWGRLNGHRVSEVLPIIDGAWEVLNDPSRREEFLSLEPANKWGSLQGVREVFEGFLRQCRQFPNAVIETHG